MTRSSHPRIILVTPRSLTDASEEGNRELRRLRDVGYDLIFSPPGRIPTEAELRELVPGISGWIAGVEPITAEIMDAANDLRVIARNGAGIDNIDLSAAEAKHITVTRAAGANAQGVAELTLALALTCLRNIPWAAAAVRAGQWVRWPARELADVTVGVVGLGAIGQKVAAMFSALGARVVGFDPFASSPSIELMTLEQLLEHSDVVTFHAPPPENGLPLLDSTRILLLRAGAIVINTARASLVDADAMLVALNEEQLSAYAVDAFASEPPELTPLLLHPRVVATPHLGAFTTASINRATSAAVTSIIDTLGA